MSEEFDPLADLGLENIGDSAPSDESTAEDTPVKKRTPVKIAEIVIAEDEELAPLVRNTAGGGGRESQYKFDELAAPKPHPVKEGQFVYSTFLVTPAEGEDADKVKRSVQSATTAENRKAKEAGTGKYFVTRTVLGENGAYVGTKVYRTDDPKGE